MPYPVKTLVEKSERGGEGVPVFVQDQTTPLLDLLFLNHKGVFQLASNTDINSRFFNALPGHSIVFDDIIELANSKGFIQARVIGVNVNTVELDSIVGDVYETGINFNRSTSDMRVDGSTTPVIFSIKPDAGQSGDINAIKFAVQDGTAMDFSTFGSADALPIGCLLRYKRSDGTFTNIFNFKSNGAITLRSFIHYFQDKVGGGLYSYICKVRFNGQENNGVTIRVNGNLGEELQIVIQDNLAALNQTVIGALAEGSGIQG